MIELLNKGAFMKAGIKTSEFILTIITLIGSATASLAGVLDPKWSAILGTISTAAYAISRGFAKKE